MLIQHAVWAMLRPAAPAVLFAHEGPRLTEPHGAEEGRAAGSVWREAMRRRRYLLEGPEAGTATEAKSPDWLYESYYCLSQQHPLIVFLLLIVMGACLALLAVFFASGLDIEDHVAFLITVPTALAIFLTIFVLVCIESVFKKLLRVFSLVIWGCLVAMGYLFMFFGGIICPWDQVSFFLFIIFVVYTMLPFSMRDAIIASVLTSTSHTVVLSACMASSTTEVEPLLWQFTSSLLTRGSKFKPQKGAVGPLARLLFVFYSDTPLAERRPPCGEACL
ncbi:hypothetical protein Z043_113750 [Scleropages formosus]|uniref:Adenylate cyclase type 2-like n=1 Tax=Scleropages formosus TaxID=113540 RepID=A0A0P7YJJ6_SCLFO|nr:hypothetical protein Z043_113750 [Scleropages formosus]